MNIPKQIELKRTIQVASISSWRVNHETFLSSTPTSDINFCIFPSIFVNRNHTGLVGLEPTTHGFGDRRSTN